MLDHLKIASPCSADWEQMEGTDRVRFCAECKKNVYNLSAMSRRDAEALLKETDGDLCTRLYRRTDGMVLTADCPVGMQVKVKRVRRKIGWAVAGALSFASAFGQDSASLSMKVTDTSGAAIARAQITVIDSNTNTRLESITDEGGKFSVRTLPPGTYSIKITSPGFKAAVFDAAELAASHETNLDITLQIGEVTMGGPIVAARPKRWWQRQR